MVDLTKHSNKPNIPATKPPPKYDKQTKAFFITINNPIEHGFSHEQIINIMHTKFKNLVYWCMCDEEGSCYHTHVYILLEKKKRWSAVQKAFSHCHIEAETKGTPQECRAYIRKEGDKYSEKAETNYPDTFYEEGNIPKYIFTNDKVYMLQQIEGLLDQGMTPEQIMQESIVFRQYETLIRKQFFSKRMAETPPLRDVKVIWHLGASGSGKSYTYTKLCAEHGQEEVFYASDYANNCTALLDGYEAQKYLFIDEVKQDSFRYGYLLQLLQGYRTQIHARYNNVYSLWIQIDITSIFTPDEIYEEMVSISNRGVDSKQQLLRRITDYCYHWKDDDGNYHTYEIPASEYKSYEDIKNKALGISNDNGFIEVDSDDVPFN